MSGTCLPDLDGVRVLLSSPDEEERREGVGRLWGSPLSASLDLLLDALGDESWRVRKEGVETLLAGRPDAGVAERVFALLRSEENAGLRNSAAEVLTRMGAAAVPVLTVHAADPDHDVRKFVLDVVGNIGDPSAVQCLIGALSDADSNVSAAAAENLGKIGDPAAVPGLLDALGTSSDGWLSFNILQAIARIGAPAPVAAIVPLAADQMLRKGVFECLGVVGGADVVPTLVEGLSDRRRSNREAAAVALFRLRARLSGGEAEKIDETLRSLRNGSVVDRIMEIAGSPDPHVRESVIFILGTIGDERSFTTLMHACRDERVRDRCLLGLKSIGGDCAGALARSYAATDEAERAFAVYMCGEIAADACTSVIVQAFADASPLVRAQAVIAAAKKEAGETVPHLLRMLEDGEAEVRDAAVTALASMARAHAAEIRPSVLPLASSHEPEQRRYAARLLGPLHEVEVLSLLVKDEDPSVRREAVGGLRNVPGAVHHLVLALVDEDVDVRLCAAEALGESGEDEALDALILAGQDEDEWVRAAAVRSLGSMGERALSSIAEAISAPQEIVALAAVDALARVASPEARALLRRALEHREADVVRSAVHALAAVDDGWLDQWGERLLAHPHWEVRKEAVRVTAAMKGDDALPVLEQALANERDELVSDEIRRLLGRSR